MFVGLRRIWTMPDTGVSALSRGNIHFSIKRMLCSFNSFHCWSVFARHKATRSKQTLSRHYLRPVHLVHGPVMSLLRVECAEIEELCQMRPKDAVKRSKDCFKDIPLTKKQRKIL